MVRRNGGHTTFLCGPVLLGWLALPRDTWHDRVTSFSHTLTREDVLYTTDAVVLEFLGAFSATGPYLRQQAAARVEEMMVVPRHKAKTSTQQVARRFSTR